MKNFKKELDALLSLHGFKAALVLLDYPNGDVGIAAWAESDSYQEHEFAVLFEACFESSEEFRDILTHASGHKISEMTGTGTPQRQEKKKGTRAN